MRQLLALIGGPAGTRTLDPLIKSQLLYHLSYRPKEGLRYIRRPPLCR